MYAPVIVFVYRRLEHTKRTLDALERNYLANETDLFIYADNARDEKAVDQVKAVREYIDAYQGHSSFRKVTIVKSEKNKGLANSIIFGVTQVINQYGRAIIVEDDILTSRDFLKYMNGALDYYENNPKIGAISGNTHNLGGLKTYKKDIYVVYKENCWGWATWKDRWENVDWSVSDYPEFYKSHKQRKAFDKLGLGLTHMLDMQMAGKIDSWAVRWEYHLFKKKQMTVYPAETKTVNIGLDGSGTNCRIPRKVNENLKSKKSEYKYEDLDADVGLAKELSRYNSKGILRWGYNHLTPFLFRIGIKI